MHRFGLPFPAAILTNYWVLQRESVVVSNVRWGLIFSKAVTGILNTKVLRKTFLRTFKPYLHASYIERQ